LLGNFLVLRRLSLMGDAISHAVLPGLVIAFIISSSRSSSAMLLGAGVAGVATVILVEVVKRLGRVEPGAAMGVVFSVLFALGVLLIEKASVRGVDLDADCVLHGQLETLALYDTVPPQVTMLAVMLIAATVFVTLFFKELRLAAFDPALATTQGFSATAMHYALMLFVAAATVASFEAVGSILVIAMLICPAATARLLTDRLLPQIVVSVVAAFLAANLGYFGASWVPSVLHAQGDVNAAGSITIAAGGLLVGALLFSPSHGVVARAVQRSRMRRSIAIDDLLASLFRREEATGAVSTAASSAAIGAALARGLAHRVSNGLELTDKGRELAKDVVRRHRLWESYLVERAGVSPDHVHETAERLEHLGVRPLEGPSLDPHGREIPR
jgi:manganese/zinc/iron transport system permease protein